MCVCVCVYRRVMIVVEVPQQLCTQHTTSRRKSCCSIAKAPLEKLRSLQATSASNEPKESRQTVPHSPLWNTSSLPT